MLNLLWPYAVAQIKKGKTNTLLIADPHIGWEMALQEKGIHVPSQTPKLLNKLTAIIRKCNPLQLVILGDVKYTVVSSELGEWYDIPDFFDKLRTLVPKITIVRGNHDANIEPLLPDNVELAPATGTVIGNIGIFHGHKWPSPALIGCKTLMMGHLHPVVVFRDPGGFKITRQVWIKASCDKQTLASILLQKHGVKIESSVASTLKKYYNVPLRTEELIVMPSFNDFLGGRPINETIPRKDKGEEKLIGPVLRSEAVNVDDSEIILLDGTYLGTLNQLRSLN
jgi:putative SbcD/Mre11-related phosphoesterase